MWKTAQTILFLVALGAALLLGWDARKHRQQAAEAEAHAAVLVAAQDSALAAASVAQAEADSVAAVLDSLEVVRAEERAAAVRRAAALQARADSLAHAIGDLMPPDLVDREIAEAVMDAVGELRQTYEAQIADLTSLLTSTELSLDTAIEEADLERRVNADLRVAFGALEKECDLWRGIAQPGLLKRIRRDAPGWAISSAISIVGWEIAR